MATSSFRSSLGLSALSLICCMAGRPAAVRYRSSLPIAKGVANSTKTAPDAAIDPARPVAIGRWTARFQNGGLWLDYDGVSLARGGLLQLFSADYAHGYYGSGSNPPPAAVAPLSDGGRKYTARFRYSSEGRSFDGLQEIEVHPANRVVFMLHGRWSAPDAGLLEWNPLRLWAYALIGASYSARTEAGRTAQGAIGYKPLPADADRLSPAWTELTLSHTAVGDLKLRATGEAPILEDGRLDPYLQDDRVFWCGLAGAPIKPGRNMAAVLTLEITPRSAAPPAPLAAGRPTELPAALAPVPTAQVGLPPLSDSEGRPLIAPRPKQVRFTGADFTLPARLQIITRLPAGRPKAGAPLSSEIARLAAELRRETGAQLIGTDRDARFTVKESRRCGSPDAQRSAENAHVWTGRGLLLATANEAARVPGLPKAPPHSEGYALRITPAAAIVIGRDEAGVFYGIQTLRQLLRTGADGRAALIGVEISDWPSLAFRGAHLFTGRNALPFHKKLIERIFSRYKLNRLVIECEYTAWKSHPEIHVDNCMPPDDLRAEVAFARDHFMEPIPLVNSLGHSEWIFKNGKHLDLAEDVHSPHAYNASDPASYRFLFDIYREALDIFHPRLFHIGHDEVKIPAFDQFGRYPARPGNLKKGVARLFVEDTNRIADWLRARHVRPMLWADMLLNENEGTPQPGGARMEAANAPTLAEAKQMRTRLPKEAVVCDWRYGAGSEQRNGLSALHQAGFDTLGCAWAEPENIRGWAQQAVRHHALGTLQTTWAGYDSNERLLDDDFRQFHAFVLAAEYAWTGGESKPTYRAEAVFARSYRDLLPLGKTRAGWLLRLRDAANLRILPDAQQGPPWQALPASHPALKLPGHLPTSVPPLLTLTYERDSGLAVSAPLEGVMLRGALPLPPAPGHTAAPVPVAVSLPVGAKADALAFLHACAAGAAKESRVAAYTLVYADGRRIEIPLRYGIEISALDDPAPSDSLAVTLIPCRSGASGLAARLYRWTNPRPEVEIARLEFRAEDPQVAPILFGVTGVK